MLNTAVKGLGGNAGELVQGGGEGEDTFRISVRSWNSL